MIQLQEKQRRTGTYNSKNLRHKQDKNDPNDKEPDIEDNQKSKAPVEATEESMMAMFGFGDFNTSKN